MNYPHYNSRGFPPTPINHTWPRPPSPDEVTPQLSNQPHPPSPTLPHFPSLTNNHLRVQLSANSSGWSHREVGMPRDDTYCNMQTAPSIYFPPTLPTSQKHYSMPSGPSSTNSWRSNRAPISNGYGGPADPYSSHFHRIVSGPTSPSISIATSHDTGNPSIYPTAGRGLKRTHWDAMPDSRGFVDYDAAESRQCSSDWPSKRVCYFNSPNEEYRLASPAVNASWIACHPPSLSLPSPSTRQPVLGNPWWKCIDVSVETISSITARLRWEIPWEMLAHTRANANKEEFSLNLTLESCTVPIDTNRNHHHASSNRGEVLKEWKLALQENTRDVALTPGRRYSARVELRSAQSCLPIMEGASEDFEANFSLYELERLKEKAEDFLSKEMHDFEVLYRCMPLSRWRQQVLGLDPPRLVPMRKSNTGHCASPINRKLDGIFFNAQLRQGQLPDSSPFGDYRFQLPAWRLLHPESVNLYFADFYCLKEKASRTHYVTVVVAMHGSASDTFCNQRLPRLNPLKNPFLQLLPGSAATGGSPARFRVNSSEDAWVEVYWTGEEVPLEWGHDEGRLVSINTIGLGSSAAHGVASNSLCDKCNLYPGRNGNGSMGVKSVMEYMNVKRLFLALISTLVRPHKDSQIKSNEGGDDRPDRVWRALRDQLCSYGYPFPVDNEKNTGEQKKNPIIEQLFANIQSLVREEMP